jgi:uncharacterized membrane protein YdjX (TVP38/TMEM64 family)
MTDWLSLISMVIGAASGFACGYMHVRFGLRKKLETQLRKEIYDSAKLDGAFEFAQAHLFGVLRPKPKNGDSNSGS